MTLLAKLWSFDKTLKFWILFWLYQKKNYDISAHCKNIWWSCPWSWSLRCCRRCRGRPSRVWFPGLMVSPLCPRGAPVCACFPPECSQHKTRTPQQSETEIEWRHYHRNAFSQSKTFPSGMTRSRIMFWAVSLLGRQWPASVVWSEHRTELLSVVAGHECGGVGAWLAMWWAGRRGWARCHALRAIRGRVMTLTPQYCPHLTPDAPAPLILCQPSQ